MGFEQEIGFLIDISWSMRTSFNILVELVGDANRICNETKNAITLQTNRRTCFDCSFVFALTSFFPYVDKSLYIFSSIIN